MPEMSCFENLHLNVWVFFYFAGMGHKPPED